MTAPALPRKVGAGGAALLSFNGAVGAAVFALPATLNGDVGPWAALLFPAAALVMLLIAIPFARAIAAMPGDGGPVVYGSAFGRFAGFELGWTYYIARMAAFAANVHVLVDYILRWTEIAPAPWLRSALILLTIALLAAINIAGTARALRLLGGLTLLKSLPLVGLAALALFTVPLPAFGPPPPLSATEASILLVFYAFIGFENSVAVSGEARDGGRAIARAMLVTIFLIALLYFLVQLTFSAVSPPVEAGEKAPLLALGTALLGPTGALLILLAAVTSLLGNLHANMTASPRVSHALAARGDLPAWAAAVHPRFLTPYGSILLMAAIVAALALSGGFVWLAVVSTLARMAVYAVTIAAWLKIARRSSGEIALGVLGILLCAAVSTQATAVAWATLAALLLAGLLLFLFARRAR
ncbi:APC family permease [Sphingomonas glaciei]|uniref:Arginine/agmatine antiporter n=1 Tax=Sphingomonas glaciei TaxID=2938948 RepID=A0ABY5MU26_9SPHN|nr:amino acid permease [Sphingomonas glaciei]UUR07703.1 APC family permease [Sphingomonas glaciei]